MADREVEEEPQGGDRKGEGTEGNELEGRRERDTHCLVWLSDVAHDDCTNRDKKEVAYSRVDAQMSEK